MDKAKYRLTVITKQCPYPATLTDESSGVVVSNQRYHDWMEGAWAVIEAIPEHQIKPKQD